MAGAHSGAAEDSEHASEEPCQPARRREHRKAGPLPGLETSLKDHDLVKTPLHQLGRQTDGRSIAGSGAVDNDFLALRRRGVPGIEIGARNSSFEVRLLEVGLGFIGADEHGAAAVGSFAGLKRVDLLGFVHEGCTSVLHWNATKLPRGHGLMIPGIGVESNRDLELSRLDSAGVLSLDGTLPGGPDGTDRHQPCPSSLQRMCGQG